MKDKNKQNDTLTEPKVAVPEPPSSAVIEFDTETFNLSSERAAMFTATRPQGSSAKGYAEKVAKSLDSAKDEIKKKYFGKNKELGDEWEREWLGHRNKKVDDAYQYEVAQVIHGAKVDNDSALARQFSSIVESFDIANAAAFFLTGATIEASGDKFAAKTANMSLRNKDNPIDPNDPNKDVEAAARAQEELDAVNERNKDIETAQTFFNGKIDLARESASAMLAKLHKNQYEHAINVLGYSPEAAGAFANTQIQKNVKKTLQDIVATNPESAKRVLAWLARADATKIQEVNEKGESVVDKDGKPVYSKTKWNPLGRWCLSGGDVAELAASAEQQLYRYKQTQRIKMAQNEEAMKLKNANIRMRADQLAIKPILNIDEMNKLFAETAELGQNFAGAAETSAYLRSIVERAERKYSKAQTDSARMTTEQEFEEEYNTYMDSVKGSAPLAFFAKQGRIQLEGGRSADVVSDVDGQNRMILLINNGLSRGVIKGKVWTDRLKTLESQRADEDYYAAMEALADAGITVDVDATKDLVSAQGDRAADMDEEMSGDTASGYWMKDKSTGRLRVANPKSVMYAWSDPVNEGKKVLLNGLQMNALLTEVARWQMRHVNPSPDGKRPAELTKYIQTILDKAAIRQMKSRWIGADEKVTTGFSDISLAGNRAFRAYFGDDKPRGKVYNMSQFYGRDMQLLRGAVMRGEIPTTKSIIDALNASVESSKK